MIDLFQKSMGKHTGGETMHTEKTKHKEFPEALSQHGQQWYQIKPA